MGFDYLLRTTKSKVRKAVLVISIIVAFADLTSAWWNYHMIVPAKSLMSSPAILKQVSIGKTYTVGYAQVHNNQFIPHGWGNPIPYIALYKNSMAPDANTMYGVTIHDVYLGRNLYRSDLADALLQFTLQSDTKGATLSSGAMLNLLDIRTVISYLPIQTQLLTLTTSLMTSAGQLFVYDNPVVPQHTYVAYEATTAATLSEAATSILDPSFIPGQTVLLEKRDVISHSELAQFVHTVPKKIIAPTVHIVKNTDTDITMTVSQNSIPGLLVLTDTFYPGWRAEVDQKEVPIYPANIKERAVILPQGSHEVRFFYQPQSMSTGLTISIITEFLVVLLTVAPIDDLWPRTGRKVDRHASRHPHSRDR